MRSKGTVLVVDDQELIRESLKALLEIEDYSVGTAENGKEGLEKTVELNPDCVVLDIMMPVMDGYEFMDGLRSNERLKKVQVIVLTAKTDPEDMIKALELGSDDYLTKPFNNDELLLRVQRKVERSQEIKESARRTMRQVRRTFESLADSPTRSQFP